ncbi:MAG: DUF86 domain-containing protein [Mesorhizobium sp.]|nr:HepT-like ribonuclease domain-containing protein [Mesorhizobium sp.]MCO5164495.1 DUF86 domain-containing protein [Mesorhizobium sp.]
MNDIVLWGERLSDHVSDLTADEFLVSRLVQDAMVRCLEYIGEASHQALSSSPKAFPAHIEFAEAYWARNRIAHGYYDLEMRRVWATATISAPKLVADVRQLLAVLGG